MIDTHVVGYAELETNLIYELLVFGDPADG